MRKRTYSITILIVLPIIVIVLGIFQQESGTTTGSTSVIHNKTSDQQATHAEDLNGNTHREPSSNTNSAGNPRAGKNPDQSHVVVSAQHMAEVKNSVVRFDAALKNFESKRTSFVPQDPKDNGNVVKAYISEPSIDEVAEIGKLMSSEIGEAKNEMRSELRKQLQKRYDDHLNFKKPFRYVDAVRADKWALIKISVADTEGTDGKDLSFTADFFMDPKKPVSENRYSHLFGLEEVPK